MIKAIISKFGQNDELSEVLAATREVLVEACPKDVFWGAVALAQTIPAADVCRGQNILGKMLVELHKVMACDWFAVVEDDALYVQDPALEVAANKMENWISGGRFSGCIFELQQLWNSVLW